MIFKIIFLVAALKLHDVVAKPLPPTILFISPIAFISLIITKDYLLTLASIAIYAAIVYGFFWLLTRYDNGPQFWAVLMIGGIAIVLL